MYVHASTTLRIRNDSVYVCIQTYGASKVTAQLRAGCSIAHHRIRNGSGAKPSEGKLRRRRRGRRRRHRRRRRRRRRSRFEVFFLFSHCGPPGGSSSPRLDSFRNYRQIAPLDMSRSRCVTPDPEIVAKPHRARKPRWGGCRRGKTGRSPRTLGKGGGRKTFFVKLAIACEG